MNRLLALAVLASPAVAVGQEPPPPPPPADELWDPCLGAPEPELVGGLAGLQGRLVYPPEALAARAEGRVIVSFVVGPDGETSGHEVWRSADERLNAEALRVVATAAFRWPDSVPEGQRRTRYSVPVTFRLPE